jgi:hypothetical protein
MNDSQSKNSKIAGCSWLFFGRPPWAKRDGFRGRLVLLAVISLY